MGAYLSIVVLGVLCCGTKKTLAVDREPLLSVVGGVFISSAFVALLIKLWYDGNEKR